MTTAPTAAAEASALLKKPWIRVLINAGGAALLWGSWAAFVHRDFPLPVLLKAAFTQAFISAFFTTLGASVLEALFARFRDPVRVPVAALGTFTFIFTSVITLHHWSGTPNILFTVAPTMALSFFYCFGYALSLKKIARSSGLVEQGRVN